MRTPIWVLFLCVIWVILQVFWSGPSWSGGPVAPPLTEFTGKCVFPVNKTYVGDWQIFSLSDRIAEQWTRVELAPSDHPPTIIHTPLIVVSSSNSNINHAFHDDVWSVLVFGKQHFNGRNLTLALETQAPWVNQLLKLAARAYGWTVLDLQAEQQDKWICSDTAVYLNGFVRSMKNYGIDELPSIRADLRAQALQLASATVSNKTATTTRERIIIYTRQDTNFRQIVHEKELIPLFDSEKFEVVIQHDMPRSFAEQVQLFSSASLLIAPNGGWSPNVLWMADTACLVELHLYKTDSWIQNFGLERLFPPGRFMTLTGKYNNLKPKDRIKGEGRRGGDDMILGEMVAEPVQRVLSQSKACRRFLAE